MAHFGRWTLWVSGILAVAVFAMYALGPIYAFPGMRLGGQASDPPASWADVNDHEEILIRAGSFPPWVVRAWYVGTDEGLYMLAWRKARWWQLVQATPEAHVRIGNSTFSVRAIPIEAKSEYDAVASAYRAKYSNYVDAELYGRAMAAPHQLLRLEPVP